MSHFGTLVGTRLPKLAVFRPGGPLVFVLEGMGSVAVDWMHW